VVIKQTTTPLLPRLFRLLFHDHTRACSQLPFRNRGSLLPGEPANQSS
jgi:hypothetical protein